jgi:hypothetical protein
MRKLLIITLLFILCQFNATIVRGQNGADSKINTITNKTIHDTTFLLREKSKDYYHAIYIEHNRQSPYYNSLLDFKYNDYENKEYKEAYQSLKQKQPAPLKKYNLTGLPKQWVPLHRYKNKYYIYLPSDEGDMARRIITDSTLIYWYMEGPDPKPILSFKKLNDHTWFFKADNFYLTKTATLIIHLIDPVNKIAVFEDSSAPKGYRYSLYIPKENAKKFDLVVNYCATDKTPDFLFDKIDYAKLLNGK